MNRFVLLSALNRETSYCSGLWLMQRFITTESDKNKWLSVPSCGWDNSTSPQGSENMMEESPEKNSVRTLGYAEMLKSAFL